MKRFASICIAILSISACAAGQPPKITADQLQAEFQNGQRVVVGIIGNSKACGYRQTGWENLVIGGSNIDRTGMLTQAGEGNPVIHGWVQDLQRWLKLKNSSSIIYNYAGSGWTTQNHINHGTVSALAAQTPKPIAVFIQMNVNDRLKDSVTVSPAYGGMSWSAYLANTRTIIRELIAANILPILVKEDNSPLPAGAGWKWGEYTAMGGTNTGTNDATHRPFSDYVNAYDTIAADTEWVTDGVGPLTVLDAYKPSLNTGQEPQYRYQYSDSTYDLTSDGLAPADFRHSLMHGWGEGVSVNDVWHQNDTGGAIILGVYQSFFNSPFLSAAR